MRSAAPDNKALIPTLAYDCILIDETADADYTMLTSETLLIHGTISAPFLQRIAASLAQDLPHTRELELAGIGHTAAENGERPDVVAAALKSLFA